MVTRHLMLDFANQEKAAREIDLLAKSGRQAA